MKKGLIQIFVVSALQMANAFMAQAMDENISAGVVGWGNLIVPGLGATLRDQPGVGLGEAGLEIGSFYGGTLLAPEQRFRIDGTIDLPQNGNINSAAIAQTMQQFGLKYHFYNTFYHYQQVAKANANTEREKSNPQPLYLGTESDIFKSPFQWENLGSPWVWPVVLGGTAYLTIDYLTSKTPRQNINFSTAGQSLYAFDIVGANPVGSYMGEDPLFRGFIQREMIGMTGSVPLAIFTQSALFSILHENHANAFVVGVYLGIVTMNDHGSLGRTMAIHFWLDMMDGLYTYLKTRRDSGQYAPLNPPLQTSFMFHF